MNNERKMGKYIYLIIILGLWGGCNWQQNVSKRSELEGKNVPYNITILTTDSTLYVLNKFTLLDSSLTGKGIAQKDGIKKEYEGELRFKDIVFIKSAQTNLLKTALVVGAVGFIGAAAISALSTSSVYGITENDRYYYPSGGKWSCPFVYAYNGKDFSFVSETFAGAVFSGAERQTSDVFQSLIPFNNKYILKITNERNETDYFNELKLIAVDVPCNIGIVTDNKGGIHTVEKPVLPLSCKDKTGMEQKDKFYAEDGIYWESNINLLDTSDQSSLTDEMVCEFEKPEGAKKIKLIIAAKNTNLGIFAFENIFKLRGQNMLQWYAAIERNQEEKNKMLAWMKREGMLHIKLWEGNKWIDKTVMPDVGPLVKKSQAAIIDVENITDKKIKIKLESAADLWMIDHIYIDCTEDVPLKITEAKMLEAKNINKGNVSRLISNDDDKYLITFPGDTTYAYFNEIPEEAGCKRYYILKSKGYYHLWVDSEGEDYAGLHDRILTEPKYGSKVFMPQWKELRIRDKKR